ncbi:methylated-DNA--[protein]-cysteine S-methyltransferase [Bdellovibrio sp. HCB2-146]|uniref:methylated-DNA--[protein]-cysteine S-methyltransferase n=1 Tax=Bdellovibrio sp. HCB2-146 TaxID=3394362 RepID=UPI0039BD1D8C
MELVQFKMESVIGPLYLVASDKKLRGIFWKKQNVPNGKNKIIEWAEAELNEYFQGSRYHFTVPLEPIGTEFQMRVWKKLQAIPYGKTISYKELACEVENSKASRAVGTANGRNPLSIMIPCHRVISSDGTLGGYAGGLPIKQHLLRLESEVKSKL